MELEKLVEINNLIDVYGQLLTDKQKQVIDAYYKDDLSLGEISENLNISRQAVHGSIVKSEKILKNYESKIGQIKASRKVQSDFESVLKLCEKLDVSGENQNIVDKIIKICKENMI